MINVSYFINYTNLLEDKLNTKDRNQLPDEAFGIPSQRRFPLHDKTHCLAAIRFFNKVDAEHEAELARNIKRTMKEYNIPADSVGPDNRLRKYL